MLMDNPDTYARDAKWLRNVIPVTREDALICIGFGAAMFGRPMPREDFTGAELVIISHAHKVGREHFLKLAPLDLVPALSASNDNSQGQS